MSTPSEIPHEMTIEPSFFQDFVGIQIECKASVRKEKMDPSLCSRGNKRTSGRKNNYEEYSVSGFYEYIGCGYIHVREIF